MNPKKRSADAARNDLLHSGPIEVDGKSGACEVCAYRSFSVPELEIRTSGIREVGGSLLRCDNCGFIFASPCPQVEYTQAFYDGKRFVGGATGGDGVPRPHLIRRLTRIESALGAHSGLTLLDVGCSKGVFLEYARNRGHQVSGIEVSEYAARIAREKGLDVFAGSVTEAEIPKASLDFIHMNHVLEHVSRPLDALAFLASRLRPAGIIVVEIPNEFENHFYRSNRRRRSDVLVRTAPTSHSHFFDPKTITRLFVRAGLKVCRLTTDSRFHSRNPLRMVYHRILDTFLLGQNIEVWGRLL